MPYQAFCTASHSVRRFLIAAAAAAALFATGGGCVRRQAREQTQCVLIAALTNDVDGGELFFVAGFVAGKDDRGARFRHDALDSGVLLLGQSGFSSVGRALTRRDLNTACAAS